MIRKLLASILMLVFVALSLPVALGLGIYGTFFNKGFYETQFVDVVYDYFIFEGQQYIDFQPLKNIRKEDFSALLEKIIDKKDLALAVSTVVDGMNDLTVDPLGVVTVKIPMFWLTQKEEAFAQATSAYLYEHLPKCTVDQTDYYREFKCVPVGLPQDDFTSAFRLALDRELLSDIPNEFVFRSSVPEQFRGQYVHAIVSDFMTKVILALLAIFAILLVAMGLLIYKPWVRVFKWEIKAVFFAALWITLLMMVLNIFVPTIMDKLLNSQGVEVAKFSNYISVYILIMGALTKNVLKFVVPMFVISLGFWIVGMIYDRNKNIIEQHGITKTHTNYKGLH